MPIALKVARLVQLDTRLTCTHLWSIRLKVWLDALTFSITSQRDTFAKLAAQQSAVFSINPSARCGLDPTKEVAMNILQMPRMIFSFSDGWDDLIRIHPSIARLFALLVLPLSLLPPAMIYYAGGRYGDVFVQGITP